MEKEGEVKLPTDDMRDELHKALATTDDDLVKEGVAIWQIVPEAIDPRGKKLVAKPKPSPAADIGERAAIAAMLEGMPDEAVQHLRRFLEAVTK